MNNFAHELTVSDVYFSPILLVIILAFFLTALTTLLLNKVRLSRFVYYPALAFVAIMTLYVVLIDKFFIHI